jgi:hypothetical protein
MLDQIYDDPRFFTRTKTVLGELAKWAQNEWESALSQTVPAWWGRMALSSKGNGGGGGILTRKIAGGLEVYYANQGKYNYMRVIEKGRASYDMKPALISGPRSRSGKNGRYTIIGFSTNTDKSPVSFKNNDINSTIMKVGTKIDDEGKVRNRYVYRQDPGMSGQGNAFLSEQVNKDGSVHRTGVRFVTVSAKSKGFIHKPIPAHNIVKGIKAKLEPMYKSKVFKKAVSNDMKDIVGHIISRTKNPNITRKKK